MKTRHAFVAQQITVDFDGTFPLEKSYRVRNTIFGGNAQTQMNVIGHGTPFEQGYSFLLTQGPQYLANFPAHFAVKHFLPILRDEYDMKLTFPRHMGLMLPFVHNHSPFPQELSWRNRVRDARRNGQTSLGPPPEAKVL